MAEKGFGVKDINLIGPSGTPTITSPNNLNLNANNVAISTNVSIGGTLSVTGNISVGGTLTYEDVTNIDSIGIITARSVIHAGAGLTVTGITTFRSDVNFSDYYGTNGAPKITFDDSSDLLWFKKATAGGSSSKIWLGGGGSYDNLQLQQTYTSGGQSEITTRHSHLFLSTNDAGKNITLQSSNDILLTNSSFPGIKVLENGVTNGAALSVEMYWGSTNTPGSTGGKKFETTNAGVVVTGICTATSFSGSGANLTNLPAATPTDSDIQVAYTVTANGSSAYRFAGNGVVSTADNPDLYLIRGQKYRFINNSGGSHPFQIREASGGTAYSTGVTNNGAASGNIDFAPTYDSPAQLVYQCTVHGGMVGNIYLRDAAGNNTNVGVTTLSSSATLHTNRILPVGGAPSGGGGGIVQIKSVTHTEFESQSLTGSGNFFDIAGMSVTITPKFNTSKIFVMTTVAVACNSANKNNFIQLRRDSTDIAKGTEGGSVNASFYHKTRDNFSPANINIQHLDSPGTTSAVTYKVRWSGENSTTYYLNRNASNTNEGMVSSITVMEFSA